MIKCSQQIKKLGVLISTLLIGSCVLTPPKYPLPIDQMHQSMQDGIHADAALVRKDHRRRTPRAVSDALIPVADTNLPQRSSITQRKFDVIADKMSARTFFMGLVDGTPYNMVVSPAIDGVVSVNLKNVTIEEAMDAMRDMYGYQYQRTSYGFEVMPQEIQTEIFSVNYLDVKRIGKSTTALVSGQISSKVGTTTTGSSGGTSNSGSNTGGVAGPDANSVSISTVNTDTETNFWKDLQTTLKAMVPDTSGRSVIVSPSSGIVVVHAFTPELRRVAHFLDRLQTNMQRQVVIEAKVLEVTLNNSFQSGIDWSLLGNPLSEEAVLNQTGNGRSFDGAFANPNSAANAVGGFDSLFTLTLKGSFRTLVRLLQVQGNVQVLSSPRISTTNNQKAVIKVGQDEFFVTGVSSANNVTNNGTNNSTTPTQDVSLTPFFSGVTLDVTPQISRQGTVILHIHPSISKVTQDNKVITLGSTSNGTITSPNTLILPLAKSTIRESDNIVRAKNGQVVVIGGLMSNIVEEELGGVPFISRIPFIGSLFRRTSQTMIKTEVVVLLRPILMNNHTIERSLERADNNIESDKRNFHAGSLSDVFGNEGECTDS